MSTTESLHTSTALAIRLFGPWDVQLDNEPLRRLHSRKGQWLLALLVLRHGRDVDRDWIAGTLWPDSLQERALANLRLTLTDLRQALGHQAYRLQSPTSRTLRLDLSGAQVDLLAFDAALQLQQPDALQQAVALYRGTLLEGCEEEWVVTERSAREQSYLQALERLADLALSSETWSDACGYARRITAIEPLRESAHRVLIQAHASGGDPAAAMQVYRELREYLHRELNSAPDPQTTALFQQIRDRARDQAQRTAVAPTEAVVRTLPTVGRLPKPLTPLLGREEEIPEVIACMAHARLVTLIGTGGVGKTRMALAVAEQMGSAYPDGAWFVDLAGLSDPSLVAQAVATTLGLQEAAGRPPHQTLEEGLRSRRLLLVLDNCEHLIEACSALLWSLLQSCPEVQVLATSRQDLGLTGEIAWRVPSLPTPDPQRLPSWEKDLASVLMEYEAVQLFVDRALRASPSFRLTSQNAMSVAQMCHRLDGIPLALELAAARVRLLSVEEIASRLDDRFRLLTGGSRAAQPRQQTLRNLIDWSYELLSAEERLLLGRLSVFAGGWTLEAAEAVCGDFQFSISNFQLKEAADPIENGKLQIENSEVLDLLSSLVDKSLVLAEAKPDGTRFRLLETIRQYGSERLHETGEAETLRERHRDFFLALAEEAEQALQQGYSVSWIARLEADHDNLRSAVESCRTATDGADVGLRLVGALWRFWHLGNHWSEGRGYLAEALGREEVAGRTQQRVKALTGACVLAQRLAEYATAKELALESLEICRELGDRSGISDALLSLGNLATYRGDFETAGNLFEESLAIRRELGDRRRIAALLDSVGNIAKARGDYEEAKTLMEESLAIRQELGDKLNVAYSLTNLGIVTEDLGDFDSAWKLYEESLKIERELGDRSGISYALHNMAMLAQDRGDYRTAWSFYGECMAIMQELGDKHGIAASLQAAARLLVAQGHPEQAARLYGATEVLLDTLGIPFEPRHKEMHEQHVTSLQAALGEESFAAEWAQGRAMSWEQAVVFALQRSQMKEMGNG